MRKFGIFPLMMAVLSGCTVSPIEAPARIYNVDTGAVFRAAFKWTGRQGKVSTITPGGAPCSGEYSTQSNAAPGPSGSWGSIYLWGYNGFSSTTSSYDIQSDLEKGTASLRCEDGNVIECEYVVNSGNHGHGYCRDNQQNKYGIMF